MTYVSMFVIGVFLYNGLAQEFSSGPTHITESNGQVNYPMIEGVTITHSMDPNSVFLTGSLACRVGANNVTLENHYWRSFVLSDFNIATDYTITLVDIGIQEAVGPNGGIQPLTCNLYITNGTAFPGGYPSSLTLIGTTTLDVPDQSGTHFPIPVNGTAPAGSELVVEISIPNGILDGNIFFIGINDFGQTAPSYVLAPICGFSTPIPTPTTPGFLDQHYVMSVTGDTASIALGLEDPADLPQTFYLDQNYPNPFNPSTTIEFSLPQSGFVTLKVYNVLGEEMATLVSEKLSAKSYSYVWNASKFAGGIYLYRLQAGDYIETRKMVLMK